MANSRFFESNAISTGLPGNKVCSPPGPQQLIGRNQERSAGLFANGRVAFEDGEQAGLFGGKGGEREQAANDRQLSHESHSI
jgi:hypothetical protein